MLAIDSPIGQVVALPGQEQRIAALTDEEFCAELNRRPCDPFVMGAWLNGARSDVITWDGWSTFMLRLPADRVKNRE